MPSNPESQVDPSRFKKWRHLLVQFVSGQLSIQFLNLITGFMLLQWLSVREYAQFGLAFAFQTTIVSLVDLGFSGSIVALVGHRGSQKDVVGNYIQSAQYLRGRLMWAGIVGTYVIFPCFAYLQHWDAFTMIVLLLSIFATIFCQKWMVYAAPLLINGRLRVLYNAQIIPTLLRLGMVVILHFSHALTSWAAAWLGTLAMALTGLLYRKNAMFLIEEPDQPLSEYNREMLKYLAPLMPGVIFAALQGQITVGIIALFGKTQGVAEVSALGRLVQIFLLLSAFNGMVVEPYVARISPRSLPRRYLQILTCAVSLAILLSALGFLFPQPFLWIIGPRYQNLKAAVSWSILISCLNYVGSVMWTMHSARKWVFWWGSFCYIGVLTAVQVLCILTMDLSRTMGVVYFSLYTTLAVLFVHIATAIYGFSTMRGSNGETVVAPSQASA